MKVKKETWVTIKEALAMKVIAKIGEEIQWTMTATTEAREEGMVNGMMMTALPEGTV